MSDMSPANKEEKLAVLKRYFGHSAFRPGQETVIDSLLDGRDVMAVMPTGSGKSACYQIPALQKEGVTLVISPLISLMKDQVNALCENGVSAAYINSSLTPAQYDRVLSEMMAGKYRLVYVAPERLDVPAFLDICSTLPIPLIAVDEAHCVSQWGQDFRPAYLHIARFIKALPRRPVVGAFTATATDHVRDDMIRLLELKDPFILMTGFDRPNLWFGVKHARPKHKPAVLREFLEEHPDRSGIIYCSTRKGVEEVTASLCADGYPALAYHAGMSDAERKINQEDFLYDRKTLMVATNAFGMGIDKSNVSFVVHYNMPKSMEAYYQEAGRAGRDGTAADCLLLYTPGDLQTARFLIENGEENPDLDETAIAEVRARELERLHHMAGYATTTGCLRHYILSYFGEEIDSDAENVSGCGNCSNCIDGLEVADITVEAQMILSCIARTGGRYGQSLISQILRGAGSERLLEMGLDRQTTYGLMKGYNPPYIRQIFTYLIDNRFISLEGIDYPVLTLGPRAREVLYERIPLSMRYPAGLEKESSSAKKERAYREKTAKRTSAQRPSSAVTYDRGLYRALADLRLEIATSRHVPPFYIFSNASLQEMCEKKPKTHEEFLEVNGVGETKLKQYGDAFLGCILHWMESGEA